MRAFVPLAAGIAALVAGTLFGWDPRIVEALVSPPAIVRAALVAAALSSAPGCSFGPSPG